MTILHVTDLHLNPHWFEWLMADAPAHDLLCISGDLLSDHDPAPNGRQIARATAWLRRIESPMVICSGNHDLEWNDASESWLPARWLRALAGPRIHVDGDTVVRGGLRFHAISCTAAPKGAAADVWVVHAPPRGLAVGTAKSEYDHGDPDLNVAVDRFRPGVVLCGHIHDPVSWFESRDDVMFLNPGSVPDGRFPNHILLDGASCTARRVTATATGGGCSETVTWSRSARTSERSLIPA